MAWHGRNSRLNGNNSNRCVNCRTTIHYREGDYCASCKHLPERRCLDCGSASRAGKIDYQMPVAAATWGELWTEAEDRYYPWAPKPIKPRAADSKYGYVALPGPCLHCEGTNLARLEFGVDRLPEDQRECPAWKHGTDSAYTRWLNGAKGDAGITLKPCAACGEALGTPKASGEAFGSRGTMAGARPSRVYFPNGQWTCDDSLMVHLECPDAMREAVAA